jgi:hypothetical protein
VSVSVVEYSATVSVEKDSPVVFSKAPSGILSCRLSKPVKVVRKGFLTTPEHNATGSRRGLIDEIL